MLIIKILLLIIKLLHYLNTCFMKLKFKIIAVFLCLISINTIAQKNIYLNYAIATYKYENNSLVKVDTTSTIFDKFNNEILVTSQTWDNSKKKFLNSYKTIKTYDSLNNLTSEIRQRIDSKTQNFKNSERDIFEYNSRSKFCTQLHTTWWYYGDIWAEENNHYDSLIVKDTSMYKRSITYNSFNKIVSYLNQGWDRKNLTYKKGSLFFYTFDEKQNINNTLWYDWDTTVNNHILYQKEIFTYDSNNNLLTELIQHYSRSYKYFFDYELNTYSYNSNNKIIDKLSKSVNYKTAKLENRTYHIYEYDNRNNLTTDIGKYCYSDNGDFDNNYKTIYAFDSKNNPISQLEQKWNKNKSSFINDENIVKTYDENNNLLTQLNESWDTISNSFIKVSLYKYYYKPALDIVIQKDTIIITWTQEQLNNANTAKNIKYLSQIEKDAIMYLNLARLYPKQFVSNEVEDYTGPEKNKMYLLGSTYKESLIKHLNALKPTTAFIFDKSLYENAKCFAEESGEKGIRGHDRINCKKENYAECCSYGMTNGKDIALQLLIDHDVESLGHRNICLKSTYTKIGLSTHSHTLSGTCAVAEFI